MKHWAATLGALLAALTFTLPAGAVTLTANPELVARNYMGQNGAQATHPLTISKLDIRVDIAGGVARTTVEATFQNPTDAALEGDFSLDLPPGSVVTGYALDVNGAMVDGVLEGQRRATLAYQRRVRAGADPGLAVVTRDNAFRTHVFPIFPGRGRTIRMSFVTPVAPGVGLRLPLATLDPVGQVSLTVTDRDDGRTAVAGPDGLALTWQHGSGGVEAQAQATNLVLNGALSVGAAPLLEHPLIARHSGGDAFFEVAGQIGMAEQRRAGGKLRIYWDRSLSRRHDDLAAETDLVSRTVGTMKPDLVELVMFADDEPKVATFQGPGAAERLAAALKAADYSGATSLRGVLGAAPGRADLCLMMSDGRITLDAHGAERAPCLLYTVSSGADADHGFLTALARRSGGEHIDLRAEPIEAAWGRINLPGARVAQVTVDGQDTDFTLLPADPGGFRVVGKALNAHRVVVTLADGQIRSFDLDDAPTVDHDGLGALWGADRIAEANATDRPDLDRSLALARRYSVAGDGAVFVVLETLQDYVNNDIAPPDSAGKDLQREYARLSAEREQTKAQAQAERLTVVLNEWKEERSWWIKPVTPQASAQAASAVEPATRPRRGRHARDEARNGDNSDVQELVVTGSRRHGAPADAAEAEAAPPPPPPPPAPSPQMRSNSLANAMPPAAIAGSAGYAQPRQAQADQLAAKTPAGGIEIAVEAWDPNRPYLKALKAAAPGDFWTVFRAQQAIFGDQPAFYLDVGEYLFRQGKAAEAQEMARGALETPTADTTTLIIVADRMMRYGDEDRAIWLYEKVLYLDPDRPQPRRSLALALIERAERAEKRGEPASAHKADYRRAMALLNEVITRPWDQAFTGIELVALVEANHLQPRLDRLGVDSPLDKRLRAPIDVDMRVVLEWNVDATDMDLWVDEPTGERVIYNHPRSRLGGRLSHDMTQGYGPEEYLLRHAIAGDYTIRANIYATDRLNPNGPITIRAHLYRDYGRPTEKHEILDLEVRPGEDGARVVGEVKVGARK